MSPLGQTSTRPSDTCASIGPCAAVSLVGQNIRAILHKLGPVLEAFEEHHIYMVSQSSSDLNITFVVAESQAERLVRELHAMLFGDVTQDELIGATWREIFEVKKDLGESASDRLTPWWEEQRKRPSPRTAAQDQHEGNFVETVVSLAPRRHEGGRTKEGKSQAPTLVERL